MSLWLVTAHADYYPSGGTGDWKFVSDVELVAQSFFDNFECGEHSSSNAYLIRLDAQGWTVIDTKNRDSE